MEVLFLMIVIQDLFFTIVIQLIQQTFMDMAWILLGYGSDIEGGGDSLLGYKGYTCRIYRQSLLQT